MIIGAAPDIVEHCGVLRFVFSDFPLANPCGHPCDKHMHTATLRLALRAWETATGPCTTVRSRFEWKVEDPEWHERYNRIHPRNRQRLLVIGDPKRRRLGRVPREP